MLSTWWFTHTESYPADSSHGPRATSPSTSSTPQLLVKVTPKRMAGP